MQKKNTSTPKAPKQTTPNKTKIPSIDVRIDSLVDCEGCKTKAFASVNIGGAFAIHGLRVMDSEKGLFVSMPSRKDGENYREVFHPVSSESREGLNKKVLAAYEQKLTEEQRWEQNETETLSENELQASIMQSM